MHQLPHLPSPHPLLPPAPRSLLQTFGLADDIKPINALAYLLSSFVSVSSLVFLTASTSFLLIHLIHLPIHLLGRTTGSLLLLDELIALPSVLVWGRLADIYGYRLITVLGHFTLAASLFIFVQSHLIYQLFISRLLVSACLYQIGLAALTTMLSTTLVSMTTSRSPYVLPAICEASIVQPPVEERTNLLASRITTHSQIISQRSSRFSGLIGFATGLGALFAVFFLLRLPPLFANLTHSSPREALEFGVRASFYVASTIALATGILMLFCLRRRGEKLYSFKLESLESPTHTHQSIGSFVLGFRLINKHRHLLAAYAAGFAARATTSAVSVYIPFLVNQYYISTGQCQLNNPTAPPEEVKKGCHAAFALASALTGTVQLSGLLLSPLVGWTATIYSQPRMLAVSNLLGSLCFLGLGMLPSPHHLLNWPICVLLGMVQVTGIVVSLSLCASCRWQIHHSKSSSSSEADRTGSRSQFDHSIHSPWQDISGAIAGAYSLSGGLGILIGSFGGVLSDLSPRAPFYVTACMSSLVAVICMIAGRPVELGLLV